MFCLSWCNAMHFMPVAQLLFRRWSRKDSLISYLWRIAFCKWLLTRLHSNILCEGKGTANTELLPSPKLIGLNKCPLETRRSTSPQSGEAFPLPLLCCDDRHGQYFSLLRKGLFILQVTIQILQTFAPQEEKCSLKFVISFVLWNPLSPDTVFFRACICLFLLSDEASYLSTLQILFCTSTEKPITYYNQGPVNHPSQVILQSEWNNL